jgi:hypothetical protein
MDKTVQEGPVTLEVVTNAGAVALKASVSQSVGGGSAAGVLGAKACVEIDVNATQAAALAGALMKAHFPSLASEVDALVSLAQGELAKV